MAVRTKLVALSVAIMTAAGLVLTGAPAPAAIQPQPASCKIPVKTTSCTSWQLYMDARLQVLDLRTRRDVVAVILSASGAKDQAYRAGVASTKAGRCNQLVTTMTLAMLDEQYRRGKWASDMSARYSRGLNASKWTVTKVGPVNVRAPWLTWVYGPVADKVMVAARSTGLRLYARGQSTNIIGAYQVCR